MSNGDLYMEKTLVPESENLSTTKEYRVHDGRIEARILNDGSAHEAKWTEVSAEQLSSHVLANTAIARWLERNLGWRRLLRACVGEGANAMDRESNVCR